MPVYTQYMWTAIWHISPWGGHGHALTKPQCFLLHQLGVSLRELSICCAPCELTQELHCPQQGPRCCSSFSSLSEWRSLDPRYHPSQTQKAPRRHLVSLHRGLSPARGTVTHHVQDASVTYTGISFKLYWRAFPYRMYLRATIENLAHLKSAFYLTIHICHQNIRPHAHTVRVLEVRNCLLQSVRGACVCVFTPELDR